MNLGYEKKRDFNQEEGGRQELRIGRLSQIYMHKKHGRKGFRPWYGRGMMTVLEFGVVGGAGEGDYVADVGHTGDEEHKTRPKPAWGTVP